MSKQMLKQRVKMFLSVYAPSVLNWVYKFLHALRLGIYSIPQPTMDSPILLELLQQAIVKNNEYSFPNKTRSVHIVLYTHCLASGGAERQWCYLSVELAKRGYTVTLLTDTIAGEAGHYLPLLTGSSVQILSLDTLSIPQNIVNIVPFEHISYNVYKCMLAFTLLEPTHVLCQMDSINVFGGAAGVLCSEIKVLFSFRSVNPSHYSWIFEEWMQPLYMSFAKCKNIIFTGNSKCGIADYAAWLKMHQQDIQCIPNAISCNSTIARSSKDALRTEINIPKNAFVILSVQRLSKEKNPWLLLEVAKQLKSKYPQCLIVHAGTGVLEQQIFEFSKKYELENTIRFLGRRQDIPQLMNMSDMLLLTSDNEGLPNVVLEAQAMGIPVVATRVGGVPEAVIEGKTALLAPKGDVHTLVSHCATLLSDVSLRQRMGELGQTFVEENFSHAALGRHTLDAIGLPHICPADMRRQSVTLFQEGITAEEAYVLRSLVDAANGEASIFFVEKTVPCSCQLPVGSLCVAVHQNCVERNPQNIIFDWKKSTDWSPLVPRFSIHKIAIFMSNVCLQQQIRQQLYLCGFKKILFVMNGRVYRIPVIHPGVCKRLGKAITFILKGKAW